MPILFYNIALLILGFGSICGFVLLIMQILNKPRMLPKWISCPELKDYNRLMGFTVISIIMSFIILIIAEYTYIDILWIIGYIFIFPSAVIFSELVCASILSVLALIISIFDV